MKQEYLKIRPQAINFVAQYIREYGSITDGMKLHSITKDLVDYWDREMNVTILYNKNGEEIKIY